MSIYIRTTHTITMKIIDSLADLIFHFRMEYLFWKARHQKKLKYTAAEFNSLSLEEANKVHALFIERSVEYVDNLSDYRGYKVSIRPEMLKRK